MAPRLAAKILGVLSGHGPLRRRLARLLVTFSIALLIAVNLAWLSGAIDQAHTSQTELQRIAARGARDQIHHFLTEMHQHLAASSMLFRQPFFEGDAVELHLLAQRFLFQHPAFTEIAILNGAAREEFRLSRTQSLTAQDLRDRSDEPLVQATLESGNAWGPVVTGATAVPNVSLAILLRRSQRGSAAVVTAVINLQALWELTGDSNLKNDGREYVVDHEGRLIAADDPNLVLKQLVFAHRPLIQALIRPDPANLDAAIVGAYTNEHGVRVRATGLAIPGPGWAVVVEQPESIVYASIRRALYFTLSIILGGVAVSLWSAPLISRHFTGPISQLREEVQRFGEGHLVRRVRIDTGGEIGELAAQFNQMAEALASSYQGLEDKVAARTRELATRSQQLEAIRAIGTEIARELDLTAVLRLITDRAGALMAVSLVGVSLWDDAAQLLVTRTASGERARLQPWVKLGEGLVGRVAERREGMIVNDYSRWAHALPALKAHTHLKAAMAEPLLYRDRLVGVIFLNAEDPGRCFDHEDQALLRLFAAQAAIAIENARLFEEQQRALADLQRAQDELVRSQKLRGLGQMAAGIAHDLNNMLAAILGQVELLKLRGVPSQVREGLRTVEMAAADGAEVVRRLQDFARQRATSPLAPMDLRAAVEEAVEITRPRWQDEAQRSGRVIVVRTRLEGLPLILGHAPEIREALTNLIFNAVDAMPEGGTLTFAGSASPEGVGLSLTDTGVGMSDEVRQKIFEPFFTTKGVKGTGLGLSVVYGIIVRHGGEISVTSTPGHGTIITLRFQVAAKAESEAPMVNSGPTVPRRLLLIDDEAAVRTTLANLLRAAGHSVVEADSGAAGFAALATHPVDLLLTDLGMPEMTGWEVARTAKDRHPQLPVVLLTGWGEHATGDTVERTEVDRVLGKPIRLEELLRTIAELSAPVAREG